MNESQNDRLEQELRRLSPAAPPAELTERLIAAPPTQPPVARTARRERVSFWPLLLRWLVPATALFVVAFFVWRGPLSLVPKPAPPQAVNVTPPLKADDVEIQQELVKSFDTIAVLPSGEPVRFRCSEWLDEVTFRDKQGGLIVEQRTPRVEVVPIRFETY